jgi:glycerophosphoryl diester phosphodiesterase
VPPITFAHRGARADAPENTLEAFRRALELGAGGLETDAWLSADGEVVLVHDPLVRRGLRRHKVAGSRADELAELGVPRLADLYGELGCAYELSIDVMDGEAAGPIVETARAAGDVAAGRLWLCHPNAQLLATIRPDMPDVQLVHSRRRTGIDVPIERHAADLASTGVDAMNMHHTEWSAGLVALFHRFDVRAFAWDVQETRHMRKMLRIGIDALYGDHVERMVTTVAQWRDDRAS